MAQKFLLGLIVNSIIVDAIFTFCVYVRCLFFVLYMYSVRIHFRCERCDIFVDFYI